MAKEIAKIQVTKQLFDQCMDELELHGVLALDTETTGLRPYKGDRLFSVIVSTYNADMYFNFDDTPDHNGHLPHSDLILPRNLLKRFRRILDNPDTIIFAHNCKFDMHILHVEKLGIRFNAKIICTEAMARLVNNLLPSYSLANLGAMLGLEKDATVEEYITKHKLYTDIDVGKKKPRRDKHYNLVPYNIISKYGLQDGRVCFELGTYLMARLEEMVQEQRDLRLPDLQNVIDNEIQLTKTLFKMEARGIKIDRAYTEEAYKYEVEQYTEAENKFYAFTDGIEFEDSAKCFKQAFEKLGLEPGRTAKGNPSYSEENLPDNELTEIILQYRKHYKRAHTYFKNFLELADENDVIHCNFRQAGTATGRLSASEPNLQNVPKRGEDASAYPVRKCFVPREGYYLAMQDADAGEYKLMLDVAGEPELIEKVKNGLDVHTATAEMVGVTRPTAKTVNFALLYGTGNEAMAQMLGIGLRSAKTLRAKYFSSLRRVQKLIEAVKTTAKRRGFIINYKGRRLQYVDKSTIYKAPNALIQGGLSDVVKTGMNSVQKHIEENKLSPYILLNCHDELVYEVPITEDPKIVLKQFEELLVEAYTYRTLPMTWGTDISYKNWHEKEPFNF